MGLLDVSLDHKYTLKRGRIFLTGTQALVRLTLMQRQRDEQVGLNTAGYVSGYRGSPLGGMDKEFNNAKQLLKAHHVKFHPAVNEDLAATAVWGTQQINLLCAPDSKLIYSQIPITMAFSACGMEKAQALIVQETLFAMPILQEPHQMAVFWFWPVMTQPANHRQSQASLNTHWWMRISPF